MKQRAIVLMPEKHQQTELYKATLQFTRAISEEDFDRM
jgi:hypothetical protein